MYTDSQSTLQSIEYNKENHPILSQIYENLPELQEQDNTVKVPVYMRIKGSKKAVKGAIDIPEITTTKLLLDHQEG